jgi:hypothetical protein
MAEKKTLEHRVQGDSGGRGGNKYILKKALNPPTTLPNIRKTLYTLRFAVFLNIQPEGNL